MTSNWYSSLLWASVVIQSTFVSAVPTWPASTDELEDIMFLSTGYRARNFAAPVTPCAGAGGPARVVGAEWLRTVFHDMADHGLNAGAGGLDASIAYELTDGTNAGQAFNNTLMSLEPFYGPRSSMSDLIALAAYTSVRQCGGPILSVRTGRVDAMVKGQTANVPQPQNPPLSFESQFFRMGFDVPGMIGLVACGHTIGGVHSSVQPGIVPPGTTPNDVIFTDSTRDQFDSNIATEYLSGSYSNPLVKPRGTATIRNSDFKVFNYDRNVTISQLRDPSVFRSTCQTLFNQMLNVVPDSVTLSAEALAPYEAKPSGLQLYLQDGGQKLTFSGEIRIRTTNRPASSIASVQLVYKDRSGGSNCNGCTISTQTAGTSNGLDDSFSFYSFSTSLSTATSISSFNVVVTYTSGSSDTFTNNGAGFPVQDTLLLQSPQSCASSAGSLTITAAVRNTTSGSPTVNVITRNYAVNAVKPALSTSSTSMGSAAKTVGGYNIFNITISVNAAQAPKARYSVTLGSTTTDLLYVSNVGSQCQDLTAGPTLDATYLGCYTDSVSQRTLNARSYADGSMTIESCSAFCKNYNYFGTEYGAECYCGNVKPSTGSQAQASDCNMACAGNANELCGAGDRLSVYTNTKYTPPATPDVNGYTYKGCYTDSVSARTLNGDRLNDNSLTIEKCGSYCAAGNYTNFGTEFGGECYCGNQIDSTSTIAASTDCDVPCSGNSAQACGGANRINLWSRQTTTSKAKRHAREHLDHHIRVARHHS